MCKYFHILFLLLCFNNIIFSQDFKHSKKIEHYVEFLKEQKISGIDYVFQLFEKIDVVVICERMHPEYTQYDFFYQIITDPRFAEIGGKVYTEKYSITGTRMYERLDFTEDDTELKQVIDSVVFSTGFWPLEESRNMYDFLTRLYYFNRRQPAEKRIKWMGTDAEFLNWYQIQTKEDAEKWEEYRDSGTRDVTMANNIYDDFVNNHQKKALVIQNYRHSFMNDTWEKYDTDGNRYLANTATVLKHKLPGRVANIWLNEVNTTKPFNAPVDKGKLDAAFKLLGNPSLGFDMKGSPLGEIFFEIWPKRYTRHSLNFQDVFYGFIFYNPIEEHMCYQYFPEYYSISKNREEYIRRMKLIGNKTDEGKVSIKFLDKGTLKEPYSGQRMSQRKVNKWIKKSK